MAGLQELTLALRRGAEGKANLASLDEQFARGEALRDSSSAKVDQYGQVSPLAVLADVVGASQGRRQLRELKPERTTARQSVADNASALPLYQAKARLSDMGPAITYVDPDSDGADRINVHMTKAGPVDKDGKPVDLGNWVDYESWSAQTTALAKSKNAKGGLGGYKDKKQNANASEAIENLRALDEVGGALNDISAETLEDMSSFMSRFKNTLVKGMLPPDFYTLYKSETTNPQVKRYVSLIASVAADERHKLFGAALTPLEKMSADEFMAWVFNKPIAEQKMGLARMIAGNRATITQVDKFNSGTRFGDMANSYEFKNLDWTKAPAEKNSVNDLNSAPAALNAQDIDSLDDEALDAAWQKLQDEKAEREK